MFKKKIIIVLDDDKKRLISNFLSLSALQGINILLPLITFPYLVRVLGVETFGLVNLALSVIMYFNVLVSFGFELSATREISINRNNIEKLSEIFSTVIIIKVVFAIFSFFILIALILFIDSFREFSLLYFATFGVVIGNLIFPSWFFQGMERMKYITYVNMISRFIFAVLIFLVVKEKADYIFVPILNALGTIIGGGYALLLVFKLFSVKMVLPPKTIIKELLKDSFQFFLSRLANEGSRYFATTIIGLYFGNLIVGYYAIVEKVYYAFMSLGSVISQTLYPYMSRTRNIKLLKKTLFITTILSVLVIIPVLYFNEEILQLIFKVQDIMLSNIFLIVLSGIIFAIVSSIIGYPLLAAFGYIKYANISLIYASIFYMIYITIVVFLTNNIYIVASAVPLYMAVGLAFRIYFINKTKLLTSKVER